MQLKPLEKEDVHIALKAEPEHIPVRGNAIASGDDRVDREVEDAILARLDQDDVWAWAAVTVTANWQGIEGSAHLGCCCYLDEDEFREAGGYFDDLVSEALDELNVKLEALHAALQRRAIRQN